MQLEFCYKAYPMITFSPFLQARKQGKQFMGDSIDMAVSEYIDLKTITQRGDHC